MTDLAITTAGPADRQAVLASLVAAFAWDAPSPSDAPSDGRHDFLPADELARVRTYDDAVHAALPAGPF